MCGLVAIAGPERGDEPRGLKSALERLAPRGPDAQGVWHSPTRGMTLGHRRLAILDLSEAGHQPMTDAEESVALVFNGEIYNAPSLSAELAGAGYVFVSRSDTEVLVHGYRHWGFEGLIERIYGMYSLVLWDERAGVLHAAVDPAGMKPLYWSCAGGVLYAASDADALRCVLPQAVEVDAEALCHILCLGYCPAPMTVWRGVQKLQPGQAMRFVPGERTPRIWRHWTAPEEVERGPADELAQAEAFEGMWEQVVGEHMLSDVPVGIFLSGGLDSTAVALALSRRGYGPECITLSLDSADDEAPAARETAEMLGLPHVRAPLGAKDIDDMLQAASVAFDEPCAYGAMLTATGIARAARQRGKVMIAGDGGDEAFAGYTWHRENLWTGGTSRGGRDEHAALASKVGEAQAEGATRSRALVSLGSLSFVHGYLQSMFPRFHPAEAAALLAPLSPRYDEHVYAAWAGEHDRESLPWPRRAQRLDVMGFCAGVVLPKIDRSSMAVGLELRAPFLDRRVLEWGLRLPVADGGEAGATGGAPATKGSKPVLRRYLAGCTPPGVLSRPKQGFSLRIDNDVWVRRLAQLRDMRLFRDGLVRSDWEGFVGPDVPQPPARIMALWMLAIWAEDRLP